RPGIRDRHSGAVPVGFEHDVAGEQQADRRVDLQRPVREIGIAGTEDLERWPIDTELRLERGGDVDLSQDPEALVGKRLAHNSLGAAEGNSDGCHDRVHFEHLHGSANAIQSSFMNIRSTDSMAYPSSSASSGCWTQ